MRGLKPLFYSLIGEFSYDLLLDILEGYSYKKQEEINCYLSKIICSNPYRDYDSYMEVLPYEIETRSVSNSRGIRYFFAYYNLKLCLLNDNDQHLDVLNEEFYDLYCSTKNEKMKQSIIECYFEMIELATNKIETKKIINSLFKLLNLDDSIKAYEEGTKLVNKLYKMLNTLEGKKLPIKHCVKNT